MNLKNEKFVENNLFVSQGFAISLFYLFIIFNEFFQDKLLVNLLFNFFCTLLLFFYSPVLKMAIN